MAQEVTTKQGGNRIAQAVGGAISGGLEAYQDSKKLAIQQQYADVQAKQFELQSQEYKQKLAEHDEEVKTKAKQAWDSYTIKFGSMSPENQKAYLKIPANQQAITETAKRAGYTMDPAEALTYMQEGSKAIAQPLSITRDAISKLNALKLDPNLDKKIENGDVQKLLSTRAVVSEMYGFAPKDAVDNVDAQYEDFNKFLAQREQNKNALKEATIKSTYKMEAANDKLAEPPATIKEKLAGTIQVENTMDSILKEVNLGIDTGVDQAVAIWAKSKVGMSTEQQSRFDAKVRGALADYVKSTSGLAASDQERAELKQFLPSTKDEIPQLFGKISAMKERAAGMRTTLESQWPGYDAKDRYNKRMGKKPAEKTGMTEAPKQNGGGGLNKDTFKEKYKNRSAKQS